MREGEEGKGKGGGGGEGRRGRRGERRGKGRGARELAIPMHVESSFVVGYRFYTPVF